MTEHRPDGLAGGIRIGIDIGGTFTDVVLEGDGVRHAAKTLTTAAPAEGFMTGLMEVMEAAGAVAGDVGLVLHGTTLATNALIERKGARHGAFRHRGSPGFPGDRLREPV